MAIQPSSHQLITMSAGGVSKDHTPWKVLIKGSVVNCHLPEPTRLSYIMIDLSRAHANRVPSRGFVFRSCRPGPLGYLQRSGVLSRSPLSGSSNLFSHAKRYSDQCALGEHHQSLFEFPVHTVDLYCDGRQLQLTSISGLYANDMAIGDISKTLSVLAYPAERPSDRASPTSKLSITLSMAYS